MLAGSCFLGSRSGLFRSDRQGTANSPSRSMRFPRSPAERNHLGGVRRVSLFRQVVAHAFHSQRAKNLAIWQSTPVTSFPLRLAAKSSLPTGGCQWQSTLIAYPDLTVGRSAKCCCVENPHIPTA